jgi:ribosomal protein S6--L-glutamate ligase
MSNEEPKIIVGCEEWCAFPDLGLPIIKARVDSGAKTSSMHAFNIHKFHRDGESWVRFDVHPLQNDRRIVISCERRLIDKRAVKSSSGVSETRYVIGATIKIGSDSWDIELTLANRDSMGYRMLLGREAMSGRMLVDPSLSFCFGRVSKKTIENHYGHNKQKNSGLKIGLLANNQDLYSNQRILDAGQECGHEMIFLNIEECYMKIDAAEPEVHYRGGTVLKDLDAVITRVRPSMTFYACALARQFESMGIFTMNSSASILQSRDKLFSLQLLLKNGINIPTTGFAHSPMDTNDLINMVGGAPLIVKRVEGSQRRGIVLAETKKAAASVINTLKSLNANILVQEFIKEAQAKDVRCFVIDGKVVASIQREAAPGDFNASLHQGGSASTIKITTEEKTLALKAAKILGLKIAGVDIIRSKKGPLLLEVNSSPGFQGIETVTGKDIAGKMIAAIEKKLHWKKMLELDD